jgi:hypothetical protein
MISEATKLSGELTIKLTKGDGSTEVQKVKNLVVDAGLSYIAARINGDSANPVSNMGIGTGTGAATAGDTALQAQVANIALESASRAQNVITFSATFGAGTGTGAITEAGLFVGNPATAMLCRTVFPVVNKQAEDSLAIDWEVTIAAS